MSSHPEFSDEASRLTRIVSAIDTALERQKGTYFESGANNFTNRVLNTGLREDILHQLQEYGHEPYFARLDFEGERGKQQVYFGHADLCSLGQGTILDWRCDLYSLYLGGNARKQSYRVQATGKTHPVQLLLKRRFEIRSKALNDMADTVDYRALAQVSQPDLAAEADTTTQHPDVQTDEFLIRKLDQRGDPRLQDIVATIQADQDAIIRAPLEEALLLHGVAGSGKTSIAYHRLAYLMFTDHGYKLKPREILVIGPNRMFLGYVSDLLPSLGVGGIQQRTFADWAWASMKKADLPRDVQFVDSVEERLNDPRQGKLERDRYWQSARVRGSLRFRQVLEQYAQWLAAHPPLPAQEHRSEVKLELPAPPSPPAPQVEGEVPGAVSSSPYVFTASDAKELWSRIPADATLADRREQFFTLAGQHLSEFMQREYSQADHKKYLGEMLRQRTLLRNYLTRSWKPLDLLELYEDAFQAGRLTNFARGILSADEVSALRLTRPTRRVNRKGDQKEKRRDIRVDLSDLPGLVVLHDLLYGPSATRYRHLVLDEAQDFSPLQLQVLLSACPNRSVTIVGDTAQSIYAYRGIEQWDEFSALLSPEQLSKHLIQQNYRSTAPIVALGNAVQQAILGSQALESRAIQRHGVRPRMVALSSAEQQQLNLLAQIGELQAQGHPSIAVIVSRPSEVTEFSAFLERQGLEPLALTEDQEISTDALRGVVVLPAGLSKGLEFAAVIIPNADEAHYSRSSRHDGHLLYVALSRALHELRITTVGRFTTWLEQAQHQADLDYSHLQRPPIRWTGQTLRTELREARLRQVAFGEISGDLSLRVETLLREKQFDEVLEAYGHYGQLTAHTLNDVLLRLAEHDPALFVCRALDFHLPEALREQVEQVIQGLKNQGHPHFPNYQQRYLTLMGLAPVPTPPSAPVQRNQPASVPVKSDLRYFDLLSVRKHLGKGAAPLPRKIRKAYARYQAQMLPNVPEELRKLVELGIRYNLFNTETAEAARKAFIRTVKRLPEDI